MSDKAYHVLGISAAPELAMFHHYSRRDRTNADPDASSSSASLSLYEVPLYKSDLVSSLYEEVRLPASQVTVPSEQSMAYPIISSGIDYPSRKLSHQGTRESQKPVVKKKSSTNALRTALRDKNIGTPVLCPSNLPQFTPVSVADGNTYGGRESVDDPARPAEYSEPNRTSSKGLKKRASKLGLSLIMALSKNTSPCGPTRDADAQSDYHVVRNNTEKTSIPNAARAQMPQQFRTQSKPLLTALPRQAPQLPALDFGDQDQKESARGQRIPTQQQRTSTSTGHTDNWPLRKQTTAPQKSMRVPRKALPPRQESSTSSVSRAWARDIIDTSEFAAVQSPLSSIRSDIILPSTQRKSLTAPDIAVTTPSPARELQSTTPFSNRTSTASIHDIMVCDAEVASVCNPGQPRSIRRKRRSQNSQASATASATPSQYSNPSTPHLARSIAQSVASSSWLEDDSPPPTSSAASSPSPGPLPSTHAASNHNLTKSLTEKEPPTLDDESSIHPAMRTRSAMATTELFEAVDRPITSFSPYPAYHDDGGYNGVDEEAEVEFEWARLRDRVELESGRKGEVEAVPVLPAEYQESGRGRAPSTFTAGSGSPDISNEIMPMPPTTYPPAGERIYVPPSPEPLPEYMSVHAPVVSRTIDGVLAVKRSSGGSRGPPLPIPIRTSSARHGASVSGSGSGSRGGSVSGSGSGSRRGSYGRL